MGDELTSRMIERDRLLQALLALELPERLEDRPGPPPYLSRHPLNDTRESVTIKFKIFQEGEAPLKVHLTIGLYPDGSVGEFFVRVSSAGSAIQRSTIQGVTDCWALACSMLLQQGVPLRRIVNKFKNQHFEPSDPKSRSIVDRVCKILEEKYLCKED